MKTTFTFTCLIAILFMSTSIFAQGEFDLRFTHNSLDCSKQKVYVDIEVKANSQNTTFNLADQNYRFSFNDAVGNPEIFQELDVTSNNATAFYNPHHLTGSVGNIVSYNVELIGGAGVPVNNVTWTSVGRLAFDIVDPNGTMELIWRDNQPENFPPTFISEKTDAGKLIAIKESVYTNYSNAKLDNTNCDEGQVSIAELFPNPVSGNESITIKYDNQNLAVNPTVVITSIDGKLMAEQEITLLEGLNNIEYDTQNLPTGVYFIQINDSEWKSKSTKFVKID